ncbi:hypothetical protein BJF77_11055 [Kocuria sp. CNJ-770]|uniref:hypothetical protein n=1 Tax=Kocuria sp. CNJ-770 TaxID=1904964 RepID=UPI000968E839|nr:hypothetical protein [Kocuria sp. CNJ-770]OLT09318.1 hypothetical protein BJF77_11055 [Kocuria sp. CNJ-770]
MNAHAPNDPEDRSQDHEPETAIESLSSSAEDDDPQFSLDELIDIERRIRQGEPVSEAERKAYEGAKRDARAAMANFRFRTSDLISPTTLGMLRSINDQQNSMATKLANFANPLASVDWSALTAVNFKVPTVSSSALLGVQNLFPITSELQRLSDSITDNALRNIDLSFRRVEGPDTHGDEASVAGSEATEMESPRAEMEQAEAEAEVIWELNPAAYGQAGLGELREVGEAVKTLCTTAIIGNGLMREQIAQNDQTNRQLSALHDSFIGVSSDLSAVKGDVRTSGQTTNRIAVATLITAVLTLIVAVVTLIGL